MLCLTLESQTLCCFKQHSFYCFPIHVRICCLNVRDEQFINPFGFVRNSFLPDATTVSVSNTSIFPIWIPLLEILLRFVVYFLNILESSDKVEGFEKMGRRLEIDHANHVLSVKWVKSNKNRWSDCPPATTALSYFLRWAIYSSKFSTKIWVFYYHLV